jgi:hypothetical protein
MYCALLAVLLGPQTGASAQSKAELRESMKERYPVLQRLREQGKVGETYRGYVEAVTGEAAEDEQVQEMVKAENADRRRLYEIIAMDVGTTSEAVGRINAQRIFDDAEPDTYFKTEDDAWKRKKQIDGL